MALALTGAGAVTGLSSLAGTLAWSSGTLRADTARVLTGQTTTSTSYTDLATVGPSVTVTTGTRALVIISAWIETSTTSPYIAASSYAISGATTSAAPANILAFIRSTGSPAQYASVTAAHIVTGLTAGSNTFTMKYQTENASYSAYFSNRIITVIDLGS